MAKSTKTRVKAQHTATRSTAIAVVENTRAELPALVLPAALSGYSVARAVTMRNWKFRSDALIYAKFLSVFYRAAPRKGGESKFADGRTKEPPMLAEVVDVEAGTGEIMTLVIPAVLQSELMEKYPGNGVQNEDGTWETPADGYVGKTFAIQSFPRDDTATPPIRYRRFRIAELTPPEGQ